MNISNLIWVTGMPPNWSMVMAAQLTKFTKKIIEYILEMGELNEYAKLYDIPQSYMYTHIYEYT